jgi:hypothetical protein
VTEGVFVFFQAPVYGGGVYPRKFCLDLGGDAEGRPLRDEGRLPPREGGWRFSNVRQGLKSQLRALLRRERSSIQPEAAHRRSRHGRLYAACLRWRAADFRWRPARRVNSSSKARFSFLAALWRRCVYSRAAAWFSCIVNPIGQPPLSVPVVIWVTFSI